MALAGHAEPKATHLNPKKARSFASLRMTRQKETKILRFDLYPSGYQDGRVWKGGEIIRWRPVPVRV